MISLMSASYVSDDPVMNRLSYRLCSAGFHSKLLHVTDRELIISDPLSRLFETVITITGLLYDMKSESRHWIEKKDGRS